MCVSAIRIGLQNAFEYGTSLLATRRAVVLSAAAFAYQTYRRGPIGLCISGAALACSFYLQLVTIPQNIQKRVNQLFQEMKSPHLRGDDEIIKLRQRCDQIESDYRWSFGRLPEREQERLQYISFSLSRYYRSPSDTLPIDINELRQQYRLMSRYYSISGDYRSPSDTLPVKININPVKESPVSCSAS